MVSANTSAQIQPWHAYLRALEITHTLVEPESSLPATPDGYAARARLRLARLKMLLGALGNPHHQTPLIHVAGTSGKGSTSAAIAGGLHRSGYRTGLHTSPYLQSATEKLQIDGTLISGSDFAERIDEILQTAAGVPEFVSQPPSYGEVWMALALYWFSHERVDVAVIETGAGGRFDLSNVITPVMSVITSVGIDHTETLGSTIREIAWHKAGIIKRGVPVVTAVRDQEALDAIVHEATLTGSQVIFPPNLSASLPGGAHSKSVPPFQQSNLALAATTLRAMRDAGFETSEEAIEIGLTTLRLPGRFEIVAESPTVLLDGAHNVQKAASLAEALGNLRPAVNGRTVLIFGSLESKHPDQMLRLLTPQFDRLILTAPVASGKVDAHPAKLADELAEEGYAGEITVETDPQAAMSMALGEARPNDLIVVTGSLYLIGNIRERWFSTRAIVEQQTPWPEAGMR